MTHTSEKARDLVLPMTIAFSLLLLGWVGAKWFFQVEDYMIPYPWTVVQAAAKDIPNLLNGTWLTARAAIVGFALSVATGTVIAIVFAQFRFIRLGCFPFAIVLQTVPVVAIAPLIVFIYGVGYGSVVLVSFILSLFPVIANFTAGLTSVPQAMRDLFALTGASRLQVILKLEIPHAIPSLVTGMRTSAGLAVIGAIVGEFFAGNSSAGVGLGFMIPQRIAQMQTDRAFAATGMSALLGIAMFGAVSMLSQDLLLRVVRGARRLASRR